MTPDPRPVPVEIWTTWGLTAATTETNVSWSAAAEPDSADGTDVVEAGDEVVVGAATCAPPLQALANVTASRAGPTAAAAREKSRRVLTCPFRGCPRSGPPGPNVTAGQRTVPGWSTRGGVVTSGPARTATVRRMIGG